MAVHSLPLQWDGGENWKELGLTGWDKDSLIRKKEKKKSEIKSEKNNNNKRINKASDTQ